MASVPAARWSAYLTLLALALVLLGAVFLSLWRPLLLAVVLAGALANLEDRLAGARRRRRLAAALLVLGVVVVVLIPVAAIVHFAVSELIAGVQAVSAVLQRDGVQGLIELVPLPLRNGVERLIALEPGLAASVAQRLPAQGLALAGGLAAALSASGRLMLEVALMLVALYFLLADGPQLAGWVRAASPLGSDTTAELFWEVRQTSSRVLLSLGVTAGAQALLALAGFLIAGVPHPLFFAALTLFAAFIPSVGTSIVSLPLALFVLVTGHWGRALFLALWAILVTGTVDNLLKPYLARGGAAELHGGLVFFAMLGGISLFGPLGLIVGPVALALVRALVVLGRRGLAEAPGAPDVAPGAWPPPATQRSDQLGSDHPRGA